MSELKQLWYTKYRPKNLSEYIFKNETHKAKCLQWAADKDIPHLLFSGPAGSGKTSLANALIAELDVDQHDLLMFNGSDENGIDVIRNKIKNHIENFCFGKFKVIFIDEGDYLSQSAQAALRNIMQEEADRCRFIITCNHPERIIAPIRESRMHHLKIDKADFEQVINMAINVLSAENVQFDDATLVNYIDKYYPDTRRILNEMQCNAIPADNGFVLTGLEVSTTSNDTSIIADLLEVDNWSLIRETIQTDMTEDALEDELYVAMYKNLHKSPAYSADQSKLEMGMLIVAEYLDRHYRSGRPLINADSMVLKLMVTLNG